MLCFLIDAEERYALPFAYSVLGGPRAHKFHITYFRRCIEEKLQLPVYTTLYGEECLICYTRNKNKNYKGKREVFPLRNAKLCHASVHGSSVSFMLDLQEFVACPYQDFQNLFLENGFSHIIDCPGADSSLLYVFDLPNSIYNKNWKRYELLVWENSVKSFYNFIKEDYENAPSLFVYVLGLESSTSCYQICEPTNFYWYARVKNNACYDLVIYTLLLGSVNEETVNKNSIAILNSPNLSILLDDYTLNINSNFDLLHVPFITQGNPKCTNEVARLGLSVANTFHLPLQLLIDNQQN